MLSNKYTCWQGPGSNMIFPIFFFAFLFSSRVFAGRTLLAALSTGDLKYVSKFMASNPVFIEVFYLETWLSVLNNVDHDQQKVYEFADHFPEIPDYNTLCAYMVYRIKDINARSYGATLLSTAILKKSAFAIQQLLQRPDLYVNMSTVNYETPLMLAVMYSDSVTVSLLIQKGSQVNTLDWNGESALHHACKLKRDEDRNAKIEALLDNNAQIFLGYPHYDISAPYSFQESRIKKALVEKDAEISRSQIKDQLLFCLLFASFIAVIINLIERNCH